VINHTLPLAQQAAERGIQQFDVILNLADTDAYWEQMGQLIAPQGHVGLIVEPRGALRIGDPYKAKSVSIHWEFMFTRARFATADMAEQHRILKRAASLVDAGALHTPHRQTLGPINAGNLQQAHALLESGQTIGKLTLAGWD
jgi:NADPH:quinone reductase